MRGPLPQARCSVLPGVTSDLTPGMVTSVIWTGAWSVLKVRVRLDVVIGAKVTVPLFVITAPRAWPPEPVITTWAVPEAPAGRLMVIRLTVTRWPQLTSSLGCASAVLAVQPVAGLPSKAFHAWSSGSDVSVDDAVTVAWPANV